MEFSWTDIFILITTLSFGAVIYIKWIFNYWKRLNIPYMPPKLPMGNFEAPWSVKKGYHQTLKDIHLELKAKGHKHAGVYSSLRPIYVPIGTELLKNILIKDFQYFTDRGHYYCEEAEPLSAHLFNLEGDKWRHLRTKLSPTFTSGRMKSIFQLVVACANGLENQINKLCLEKKPVNVKEISALFTTNVIGTCALGLDCNCFENPENEFRSHLKYLSRTGPTVVLRKFAQVSFPELCKKFKVATMTKEAENFYMNVTESVMKHRETNNVRRNDFMQLLMDINREAKNSDESLSLEQIAAQAYIFFLAGFETSSSTMTFALYELSRQPHLQDKVREEIHKVLAKYDGNLTYDGILEMTYMGQVIDETLRKYPILATLDRICLKDYQIPGENIVLKKDTKLLISLLGLHYDPEYFPDPDNFDPERFSPENKVKIPACAYMPFGEGPRICIGLRFGNMQTKIGLTLMLRDYKYKLSPHIRERKISTKSRLLTPDGDMLLVVDKA